MCQRKGKTNPYAGSYRVVANRSFRGGQHNGNLSVNIDKHSQVSAYELGDDYHAISTVVYYVGELG